MRDCRRHLISGFKIKKPQELKRIFSYLRARGKRIVFTNGCFDLLHYGHIQYLEAAKQKGDVLIVALNSDSSIKRIKGPKRPIVKEGDRLGTIAGLESVDYVTLFNEDTPLKLIKLLKPDILIKGADWDKKDIIGSDIVAGYGGKTDTVKFIPGRSTTGIIKKVASLS